MNNDDWVFKKKIKKINKHQLYNISLATFSGKPIPKRRER